ncbi:hypothetical protein [Parasphaerochaeta coccoides]|uniref:hypothetical protein n=1 Tax=Parasphaerochaeta coccoides TaxID=273376 RepID=UPI000315B3E6|nr:hypothetical protein [Parasphaerochaeta coccoides]
MMKKDLENLDEKFMLDSTDGIFTDKDFALLKKQVATHKYLVNQNIPWTISWDDALYSWLENVFNPLMQYISRWEVRSAFPNMTLAQLYFAVSDHWYYLLEKHPEAWADLAALDYSAKYGHGLPALVSRLRTPRLSA